MSGFSRHRYTTNSVRPCTYRGQPAVRKVFRADATQMWATEREAYRVVASLDPPLAPRLFEATSDASGHALVMERIEGPTLDGHLVTLSEQAREAVCRRLARAVERFHTLGSVPPSFDPGGDRGLPPTDAWYRRLRSAAERLQQCGCQPQTLTRLAEWIDRRGASVAAVAPRGLIHRDLSLRNIVLDAKGEVRIIDWEVATFGHADLDLARLLWLELEDRADLREAFYDEYAPGDEVRRSAHHRAYFRAWFCVEMLEHLAGLLELTEEQRTFRARLVAELDRVCVSQGV
ncbi:MAG: aminoglycoside phosphotransferase family protein [Deltaproteobacteria bacterium]|nr:aminoglycoside phosphotransferase family protein [Deltaproteobacteria bacterium]